MNMGPKLTSYKKQRIEKFNKTIDIVCWKHDSKLTKEENEICIKYYQLQAKKFGMSIEHYMREFQWN